MKTNHCSVFRIYITTLVVFLTMIIPVRGETVTYTITTESSVSASGAIPSGASATFVNTYTSTPTQLTKGNSMTLTLSGYEGMVIKGLTLSMHSNAGSGTGRFSMIAGSATIAEIPTNRGFNQSVWYGAWTQSFVDVQPAMTNTNYVIKEGEKIVISISASANSLFCRSFTLLYEDASRTIDVVLSRNGETETLTNQSCPYVFPTAVTETAPCEGWTFAGWSTSPVTSTSSVPTFLTSTNASGTYYAVYTQASEDAENECTLSQTLQYDTWTYGGTTYPMTNYRMFNSGAYVESESFDLSTLCRVVVYGGTYGGDSYNQISIGDGTNVWKLGEVVGNSQTHPNDFTGGAALTGTGKLRITSLSGASDVHGVRMSKIEIYTMSPVYDINYSSSCSETPITETYSATAATCENGSILLNTEGGTASASLTNLHENDIVIISVHSNSGYHLLANSIQVNDGDVEISKISDSQYSFVMPSEDVVVAASFVANQAAYTSIADICSLPEETSVHVVINDWHVTAISNNQVYVTDGTNGLILFASAYTGSVKIGDVLNGEVDGTIGKWYGATDLEGVMSGLTITHGEPVTPQMVTIDDLDLCMVGVPVKINDVTFSANRISDGINSVAFYDLFNGISVTIPDGIQLESISGIVVSYKDADNNTILEICPLSDEDIVYKKRSVTLSRNGTTETKSLAYPYTLPDASSETAPCEEWQFVGWSTTPVESTTSLPAMVSSADASTSFFAVYGKKDGTQSNSFEMVQSKLSDWSGDYLIVNSDGSYAMSGTLWEKSGEFITEYVSETQPQIIECTNNNVIWTFTKGAVDGQYSILNNSSGLYATIGTSSTSAGLASTPQYFTIGSSSTANIWSLISTDDEARRFSYYSTNYSYRTYKSPNTTGRLYKRGNNVVITQYTSSIECEEIPEQEADIVEWGRSGVIVELDATGLSKVKVRMGDYTSEAVPLVQTLTSVKESATKYNYTVQFGTDCNFASFPNQEMHLDWMDTDDQVVGTTSIMIPQIVATEVNMSDMQYAESEWNNKNVVILPGAVWNVDASEMENQMVEIQSVEVYPGGRLNISSGTLFTQTLILRNGWTRVGGKEYEGAYVIVSDNSSLLKSNAYLDCYIDYDQYYPIAVPFPIDIEDISYRNTSSSANVGTNILFLSYDGLQRSENVQSGVGDGENWKSAIPTILHPGMGYAITAKRPTGKAFSIIRMPLDFDNSWTTNGEQPAMGDVSKNTVGVTAFGVEENSATPWYAQGWNFIGNPYMSSFGGQGDIVGNLIYADEDQTEEIRYANIPNETFTDYIQVPIKDAQLEPMKGFFVQAHLTGDIVFAPTTLKKSNLQRREHPISTYLESFGKIILTDGQNSDLFGVLISDKYSDAYDLNADLIKLQGVSEYLKASLLFNESEMAFVAVNPSSARKTIPIVVRIPQEGDYTFKMLDTSEINCVKAVNLIDYQQNTTTNLLTGDYTFSSSAGKFANRFAISMVVEDSQIQTNVPRAEEIRDSGPHKLIYNQHMYIYVGGKLYDVSGKKVDNLLKDTHF